MAAFNLSLIIFFYFNKSFNCWLGRIRSSQLIKFKYCRPSHHFEAPGRYQWAFLDDRYINIARPAILYADQIHDYLKQNGYQLYGSSPTNQTFFIIENQHLARLEQWVAFSFWENTMKRIQLFDLQPAGPRKSKTLISSANSCVSWLNCCLGFGMRLLLFKAANVIINILS